MIKNKKHRRLNKKTLLLIVLFVILLVIGSYFLFIHKSPKPNTASNPVGVSKTDLSPATQRDKEQVDQHKADISGPAPSPTVAPSGKKAVQPVITNASTSGVTSYVSGIFEEGGTCTATFTMGNQQFVKTSAGFQNATNTGCTPINLTRSDFPSSGTWSVVVSYSSSTAEGTSSPYTFEVK